MRRFKLDKKYLYWGLTAFLVIAAAILFYMIVNHLSWLGGTLHHLGTILSPFVWGLVIAYLLYPLSHIYQRGIFVPLWKLLLKNMEGKEDRACRFVCVICCALPDGSEVMSRGEVQGVVAFGPDGDGGFGYDPVFYLPEKGCTMARLSAEEKNTVSHRGNALRAFREEWERRYGTDQ